MTQSTAAISPEDEPLTGKFNPNEYDWPNHLKVALEELPLKKLAIDTTWQYYDGEHPRLWLTDAIKDKLDHRLVLNMAENWCDLAVDAPVGRLVVEGFVTKADEDAPSNPIKSDAALSIWRGNKMRLAQKDVYTDAGVAGESYVFVWKDEENESGVDLTIKDSRNVWWPKDTHRADPKRVVLTWADHDEGVWRATCYYKYVTVRLVGPKLKGNFEVVPQARYFEVDSVDPGGEHGFDRVPVIRFALTTRRRAVIDRIRSLQDKINKLAANMLVTAEFNAWRKMAILTAQSIDDDELKVRPNRILVLDPGGGGDGAAPTSIWEGSASELSNFSNEQDKLIDRLFSKAYLPGHLKIATGKTLPSGAAYEADEGPFTEHVEDLQASYGESWHDVMELALGVDVEPQWRDPHVRAEADLALTVKTLVDAGVPLTLALKYYAQWSAKQLEELDSAPLSPKEQLSFAAAQSLASGGGMGGAGSPGAPKPLQPPGSGPVPKAGSKLPSMGSGR